MLEAADEIERLRVERDNLAIVYDELRPEAIKNDAALRAEFRDYFSHIPESAEKMISLWSVLEERDRLKAQAEAMCAAIDNEMVTAHIGVFNLGDDPRKALHEIISWHVMVALDPSVSSDARALIERGRAEAGADAIDAARAAGENKGAK
jgi:hypothetical protein